MRRSEENVRFPATLEQGKWEVGLRTLGRIDAAGQFNDIIIATVKRRPLRVSDIGYAEDSVRRSRARCSCRTRPGRAARHPARLSENTIKVTEAVKAKLASVRQASRPILR